MENAEWEAMSSQVVSAMRVHVMPFISPISRVISQDQGELEGTGSYCSYLGKTYLITNEHVARAVKRGSLTHQFHDNHTVFRAKHPFQVQEHPEDLAASRVDDETWNAVAHQAAAIPEGRLARVHNPVDGELFFLAGCSGERSTFLFGNLVAPVTPYLTQAANLPNDPDCDPAHHFALEYRPDLAQSTAPGGHGLPIPNGLSGSLVWNTKFVERSGAGSDWSPDDAEVTGIVWGWPSSSACLLATKVEFLRHFLDEIGKAGPV